MYYFCEVLPFSQAILYSVQGVSLTLESCDFHTVREYMYCSSSLGHEQKIRLLIIVSLSK